MPKVGTYSTTKSLNCSFILLSCIYIMSTSLHINQSLQNITKRLTIFIHNDFKLLHVLLRKMIIKY